MSGPAPTVLSVVVVIASDTTERRTGVRHLAGCLAALSRQVDAPAIEVIVPHHDDVDGVEDLRERFPWVRFIRVTDLPAYRGGREHHDVLRARGLQAARGELVGLLEDHARPGANWCASVVAAHRKAYAAVGGAIENGIDRPLNWAVYYCDFGRYQNPVPAGPSPFASDANVTYKRSALESIRASWEESFREVVVHEALMSRGGQVALDPDIVVYQDREGLRLGAAVRERFVWGRSYGATRVALLPTGMRMIYAVCAPLLPAILVLRMTRTAWTRRRHFGAFLRALPLIAVLVTIWSIGEAVGYVTGRPQRPRS